MDLRLKDIRDVLDSLRMEGRNINELEGLLIHSDDMSGLLRSTPEYRNEMSPDGLRVFGVKIIESKYAQKGTIFKIFKNDEKIYALQNTEWVTNFDPYVGGDTMLKPDFDPILGRNMITHIPDDMRLPTVVDEKKQKDDKKKKRRHSNKRKISLD